MSKIVKDLLIGLSSKIDGSSLKNKENIAAHMFAMESLDSAAQQHAGEAITDIGSTIDECIKNITMEAAANGMDGISFNAAQIAAAKQGAALAVNPVASMQYLSALKPVGDTNDVNTTIVDPINFGLEGYLNPADIAMEAFDGQEVQNSVYFSAVQNLLGSRQDAFAEMFFPTVNFDPSASGATVETDVIVLFKDVTRTVGGRSEREKFKELPLIKHLYDADILSEDLNKIVPVFDAAKNGDVLIEAYKGAGKIDGETVVTAPIKFGVDANLLGMSQSAAALAKGVMDDTDALDRRVNLDDIFFTITGDVGGTDTTETIKINIASLPFSGFTYSAQDHHKDVALSFTTENVYVNTSKTKDFEDNTSAVLGTLADNHSLRLKIKIFGTGNLQYGNVEAHAAKVELVEMITSAGDTVDPSGATFAAAKAIIDSIEMKGYSVEAYRTHSSLKTNGHRISVIKKSQIFVVPFRTGILTRKPVTNIGGIDNDAKYLNSQITLTGAATSIHAVNALVDQASKLRMATENGTNPRAEVLGIARELVNTYYKSINVNLSDIVDSVKSSERIADIKASLVNRIKDAVISMHKLSNYGTALEKANGNVKTKTSVLIGTDTKIASYLAGSDGKIDLGPDFDVYVESTLNQEMAGKLIISFGIMDSNRNTAPHPLNFGQCFWAPEVTVEVSRQNNGGSYNELKTFPRYLHCVNLPIMTEMNIANIEEALGKIATLQRTV